MKAISAKSGIGCPPNIILNDNPIINAEITEEYLFNFKAQNILYSIIADNVLKKTWVMSIEAKILPDVIIINGTIKI